MPEERMAGMTLGWNNHRDLEATVLPRWLGIAAHDVAARKTLLPVPVNLLWGWTARIWWKMRDGVQYQRAYDKGYNAGLAEGHRRNEEIYKMGLKDGESIARAGGTVEFKE